MSADDFRWWIVAFVFAVGAINVMGVIVGWLWLSRRQRRPVEPKVDVTDLLCSAPPLDLADPFPNATWKGKPSHTPRKRKAEPKA